MINIIDLDTYNKFYYIDDDCWDFSLDEINYLLKEHTGETFLLKNNRLYEVIERDIEV